ncbi:MAG: cardiolipin synthase, partial [Clostridia bacterium]|nr:cardiolipin synthase [Clostridia bacterium]
IVEQGSFFGAVLSVLREKAAAGLDVRLAYDDFGCALTLPRNFSEELRRAGIRVTVLRPVKFPLRSLNRRNHRKIAVIDGEIGYVGGINLADEYTGEKIRFGNWKDTALRVTGEPAQKLAGLFAEDAGISPPDFPPAKRGTLPCVPVSDTAHGENLRAGPCAHALLLARAERYAYYYTPYLAPDSALLHAFRCAAAAGVDVRILIPHIPDKKATFLLTRRFARELERAGVQVREYTAGFLHAKSAVTEEYAFVSSYNLDYRSLYLQAECGIAVKDGELVRKLTEDFLSTWEAGTPVKRARLPERVLTAIVSPFLPLV